MSRVRPLVRPSWRTLLLFGGLLVGCRRGAPNPDAIATTDAGSDAASTDVAFSLAPPIADAEGVGEAGAPLEDAHLDEAGMLVQRFEKGCVGPDGSGAWVLRATCDPPKGVGAALARLAIEVPRVSWNSDLAAGVTFLPTGERYLHRPHEPRVAASIGKWFWAAAALHKHDVATVEPNAVPAFAISDNARGRMLIDQAGGADAVNAFTELQMGIPAADLNLCKYQGDVLRKANKCYRGAVIENFFTTLGALMFLEQVWRGVPFKGDKRAALLRWSKLQPDFGFSIGHQLPKEADQGMHHKRAELPTGCCDLPPEYNWTAEIAIIPTPRGPYAVALSLAHSDTYANQIGAIEWASCVLYHAVAEDVPDPFAAGCKPPAPVSDAGH